MKSFTPRDRVIVSSLGGWEQASVGTIVSEPEPIETLKGPECFYWVEFDQAQQTIDGNDAYLKAQILSCYLDRA
jgi:hypothetical protein